jgi:hypothetical protein
MMTKVQEQTGLGTVCGMPWLALGIGDHAELEEVELIPRSVQHMRTNVVKMCLLDFLG